MEIKGQALANIIIEFTFPIELQGEGFETQKSRWKLYIDGSSNETNYGARLILINPKNYHITTVLRFSFKASNNEAKYEVLISS